MANRTTWKIDPAHTAVEFSIKHMMFSRVRGRFSGVEGTLEVDPGRPDDSSAEVKIDASTIDTGTEKRDEHLRSADFLDVEAHPEITFRSREVEGAEFEEGAEFRVVGDLTIRGKSREVTLDATYHGQGRDPWGGRRAGFSARTTIDRRDWDLDWNQKLETGGILVGYDLDIELDVQAVEQGGEDEEAEAA